MKLTVFWRFLSKNEFLGPLSALLPGMLGMEMQMGGGPGSGPPGRFHMVRHGPLRPMPRGAAGLGRQHPQRHIEDMLQVKPPRVYYFFLLLVKPGTRSTRFQYCNKNTRVKILISSSVPRYSNSFFFLQDFLMFNAGGGGGPPGFQIILPGNPGNQDWAHGEKKNH